MKTDFAAAKKHRQENYYHGAWKPDCLSSAAVKAKWAMPAMAKQAPRQVHGPQIIIIDPAGHLPQIEAFDRFIMPLKIKFTGQSSALNYFISIFPTGKLK